MDMEGSQQLAADRDKVWQALNDLGVLKECIPGCESIEQLAENQHHLAIAAAIGPVKARFKGKLDVTDIQPPDSYRLRFDVQGGAAGFAKGEASVSLTPAGAQTLMQYKVHAQIGGKVAQIGSRLVDAAARKVAGEFFDAFNAHVAPKPVAAGVEQAAPRRRGGVPPWVWWAAAVVLVLLLLYWSR